MSKKIIILCSMDSKGEEATYLKDQIAAKGGNPIIMDIGIGREPSIKPDIPADLIAEAGGGRYPCHSGLAGHRRRYLLHGARGHNQSARDAQKG